MDRPQPPREAVLIRLAREAAGIKAPEAAKEAGMSAARWSQIELGYESRLGRYKPVRPKDATLAHMAFAVGVAPHRLEQADRPGAAEILREILRLRAEQAAADGGPGAASAGVSLDGLTPDQMKLVDEYVAWLRSRSAETGDGRERREANGA